MTPKISMLLPARGRPANLKLSVESVFDLAAKPDEIEVLVRLDDDDPYLAKEVEILRVWSVRHVSLYTGARLGYHRMHDYYNRLAQEAVGDWLFFWNDDIELRTQDWDRLLHEAPLFSVQFPRRDTVKHADPTIPVVGRPIYEAVGRLSGNAYCDAWVSDISGYAGTSINRDDIVFHHHRLNDATMAEQNDGGKEWARFDTQKAERRVEMDKIVAAPGYAGRYDGWNTAVEYHPVDYINLAAGEVKAYTTILKGRK